jgi:hypothetical protein
MALTPTLPTTAGSTLGPTTGNGLSMSRGRGTRPATRPATPSTPAKENGAGKENGVAALPSRRMTPTRAEDVLGGGRPDGSAASRWWSRGATATAGTATAGTATDGTATDGATTGGAATALKIPAQRQPVTAGTSGAGLPIRRPMAQLPGADAPNAVPTPAGVTPPRAYSAEPDPSQVGSMLSRFYSGIHRATAEEATSADSPAADDPAEEGPAGD